MKLKRLELQAAGAPCSVAGALFEADIEALADAGVKTIINNRPDGEDPGQFPAGEARALAERLGIAYRHIPVTTQSLKRADVEAFAAALGAAPRPIVAHCRSGTRSALLWALVSLSEGAEPYSLVAEAARHGIDLTNLPVVAARVL